MKLTSSAFRCAAELEETKRKLEKSEKELEASRKMMSQMEMSVQSSNVCLFWEG